MPTPYAIYAPYTTTYEKTEEIYYRILYTVNACRKEVLKTRCK